MLTIYLTRVRVNGEGYSRSGYYYGAGQSGHSWEIRWSDTRSLLGSGHCTGREGRKTRSRAIQDARAHITRRADLKGLPAKVE